jgi:hypothetical protein
MAHPANVLLFVVLILTLALAVIGFVLVLADV